MLESFAIADQWIEHLSMISVALNSNGTLLQGRSIKRE